MSRFIQLHLLTSYPPANLNRDDLGRPKTATMGGAQRLRVSSQSLKRAWRKSDLFEQALAGHVGVRTKGMGREVYARLMEKGVKEKDAKAWAIEIAGVFGKIKKEDKKSDDPLHVLDIEQLAHFSPEEQSAIDALVAALVERGSAPDKDDLSLLRKQHSAADIALFGRMLASSPGYNTEAAAQVAHAISVHKVTVEDDFFTAVDDLNSGEDDLGAGHMGETEFAAGLFYQYICVDRDLLSSNLGDEALAKKTVAALAEAAATVAPTGKQNSFASRARASYMLAEVGDQQPRSLAVAFLKPVTGSDMLGEAIGSLEKTMKNMDQAYGECADKRLVMNLATGEGSLKGIIDGITE
jgi:CRISPR system Cascade subunit CasC